MSIYRKYSNQQCLLDMPQGTPKGASENLLMQVEVGGSESACAFSAYHVPHTEEVFDSVMSIEHTCNTPQISD